MARSIYATLKMLGYSESGNAHVLDWSADSAIGIRLRKGSSPGWDHFHDGQRIIIYDSKHGTVCAVGRQAGRWKRIWPERHGCDTEFTFRPEAGVSRPADAPRMAVVLGSGAPNTQQKSYVALDAGQYIALRNAILAHPDAVRYDRPT